MGNKVKAAASLNLYADDTLFEATSDAIEDLLVTIPSTLLLLIQCTADFLGTHDVLDVPLSWSEGGLSRAYYTCAKG